MSKEEVERLDDQGMSAWDTHDADAFVAIFADAFVINDVASPEPITTKDAARAYAQAWFTAFPDMSVKQMNRVVSEDSVAAELAVHGDEHRPDDDGGQGDPTDRQSRGWEGHVLRSDERR